MSSVATSVQESSGVDGIIFTRFDQAVNWPHKSSLWPMAFGWMLQRKKQRGSFKKAAFQSK